MSVDNNSIYEFKKRKNSSNISKGIEEKRLRLYMEDKFLFDDNTKKP